MVDPDKVGKNKWSEFRPPFWTIIIFLARLTTFYVCGVALSFSLSAFGAERFSNGFTWLGDACLAFSLEPICKK
jgi:hypothetical protein